MAGPLSPRWVNSKASSNEVLPQLTTASTEIPDSSLNRASSVGIEGQRHQRRARRHDFQAELLGNPVAESARSHFRNRGAAGGDHQRASAKLAVIGGDDKSLLIP